MHKIIFFPEKKINTKKYVCLPYINFLDPLPETYFLFGLTVLSLIAAQAVFLSFSSSVDEIMHRHIAPV